MLEKLFCYKGVKSNCKGEKLEAGKKQCRLEIHRARGNEECHPGIVREMEMESS